MKRVVVSRIGKILLLMSLLALPSLVLAQAGSNPGEPTPTPLPPPEDDFSGGRAPLTDGSPIEPPVFVTQQTEPVLPYTIYAVPTITVWHENDLKFGQLGNPQQWVNILGNVTPTNVTLTYKLNGGSTQSLSVGADTRRLSQPGDFNIELDYADLQNGSNTVVITAKNNATQEEATNNITFNYQAGNTWPILFTSNWSSGDIYDSANVIDGDWAIENGKLRPQALDYDRLVGIGDVNWTDYQVTVPFTIHGIDPAGYDAPSYGPGVGMILRWQGHYEQFANEQPFTGWQKLGALSWIRWSNVNDHDELGLQMIGYSFGAQYPGGGNILDTNSNVTIDNETEYIFKANVETTADGATYQLRVWRSDLPEPDVWHLSGSLSDVDDPGHLTSGSMVLVAHHVDVSFGDVVVEPFSTERQELAVSIAGSGTVEIDPSGQSDYEFGSDVILEADPDPGYRFVEWQGDLTGSTNPATIKMYSDKAVTAVFEPLPTLTVNAVGSGSVTINPPGQSYYDYGSEVTLTADSEDGWEFANWSGDYSGTSETAVFTITDDMTIQANFRQPERKLYLPFVIRP